MRLYIDTDFFCSGLRRFLRSLDIRKNDERNVSGEFLPGFSKKYFSCRNGEVVEVVQRFGYRRFYFRLKGHCFSTHVVLKFCKRNSTLILMFIMIYAD